jgi:hypothetical protein
MAWAADVAVDHRRKLRRADAKVAAAKGAAAQTGASSDWRYYLTASGRLRGRPFLKSRIGAAADNR